MLKIESRYVNIEDFTFFGLTVDWSWMKDGFLRRSLALCGQGFRPILVLCMLGRCQFDEVKKKARV